MVWTSRGFQEGFIRQSVKYTVAVAAGGCTLVLWEGQYQSTLCYVTSEADLKAPKDLIIETLMKNIQTEVS